MKIIIKVSQKNQHAISKFFQNAGNKQIEQIKKEAETLNVSIACAMDILYLKAQNRWSQEEQDELIMRDRLGEHLAHMCSFS